MPELPEVETLRLQLSSLIIGQTIKDIQILKLKSFIGDKKDVISKKIIGIRRFAKLLVIDLSYGLSLAVHLKMSGQLIFRESLKRKALSEKNKKNQDPLLIALPNKHTRVIIEFQSGSKLYFNDMRRFGWVKIAKSVKRKAKSLDGKYLCLDDFVKKYGPEPLKDLTLGKFKKILKSSNRPIKLILMDQEKIAGVGNIYANEALFLAQIDPRIKASKLDDNQIVKLLNCLIVVLKNGIKWGGASRNNFRNAFGEKGKVQEHFHVYDRKGMDCPNNCGEKIKRITLGGRGTFYCPKCQS